MEATRRLTSRFVLFLANSILRMRTISQLPITILTLPLDSTTPTSKMSNNLAIRRRFHAVIMTLTLNVYANVVQLYTRFEQNRAIRG